MTTKGPRLAHDPGVIARRRGFLTAQREVWCVKRTARVGQVMGLLALLAVGLGIGILLYGNQQEVKGAEAPLYGEDFTFNGMRLNPPRPAPDFTLVDQDENTFRLRDQRGQVVVLFFGYTTCPDVCPATLAQFAQVKEMLGDKAEHVRFVFVSVDPERDTPEKLAWYISHFDEDIVGLTGSREALSKVWQDYGVYVERVDDPESRFEYWLNHTSISYVIDAHGLVVGAHPFGFPLELVTEDLLRLVEMTEASRG